MFSLVNSETKPLTPELAKRFKAMLPVADRARIRPRSGEDAPREGRGWSTDRLQLGDR
jgi:hypothetical protein